MSFPYSGLHQYFKELEDQDRYSGVVLITRGQQELFAGAYGYASRPWKMRNTLQTRFDTASITKLFTSVATLQMVDRRHLDFNTRVVDTIGIENSAISRDVNIYHLLTHTSGIGDDCEEEDGEVYEDLWRSRPNYSVTETRDFLPQFIHKPANFPPGKGCRYCNCGFILLGLLVEKFSGMSYRDYVRDHIFTPAGMQYSDFLRLDRVNENTAEGADPLLDEAGHVVDWKKNIYSYPPVGSPDSGAYVTAGDLDRFLRSLQGGVLLSPELTQAMLTPKVFYQAKDGWTMMYGFVFWFYIDKSGEVVCFQKEGINAGVSAVMRYYPGQDTNVVLLSNMEDGAWDPVWKIHEVLGNNQ